MTIYSLDTKARTPRPLLQATIGQGSSRLWSSERSGKGDDRAEMRKLIDRYSMWVHRCVSINAQTAAAVPFKLLSTRTTGNLSLYGRKGARPNGPMRRYLSGKCELKPGQIARKKFHGNLDDATEILQHPVLDLLHDINDWTDGYQFREALYSDYQIFGRAFVHLVGVPGLAPEQLWRMEPHKTRVLPDPTNFVRAFRYGDKPDEVDFSIEEVLWFRTYDPLDPWGGIGPLEAWLRTIDASDMIAEFQYDLFKNHGSPDYVLLSEAEASDPQKRQMRTEWTRLFGRMFRRVSSLAFLHGKPKPELLRLNDTPRDLEYSQGEAAKRDMIGQAFGVPKSILTTDDVNRANARETNEQHMRCTIWPMIQRVEDVLNERLLPMFGDGLVLVHDNPIPEDEEVRILVRKSKLEAGWSVNELRIEEGEEPLDDENADKPMIASGLTLLEKVGEMQDPFGFGGGASPSSSSSPPASEPDSKMFDFVPLRRVEVQPALALPEPKELSHHTLWMQAYAGTLNGECPTCEIKAADPELPYLVLLTEDIRRALRAQLKDIASGVKELGIEEALVRAAAPESLARLIEDIGPRFRATLERGMEAGIRRMPGIGVAFDVQNPQVQEFIDGYVVRLARQLNGTTLHSMEKLIGEQLRAGGGIAEVANAIRRLDDTTTGYRAEMIARTETARAYVEGQQAAWKQSGVVKGKQWLLAPNPCEFCKAAAREYAGKVLPLQEAFYRAGAVLNGTDGGRMRLDYSDVTGPPLHPHCRCDLVPVLEGE